jgi:hypothetical protein
MVITLGPDCVAVASSGGGGSSTDKAQIGLRAPTADGDRMAVSPQYSHCPLFSRHSLFPQRFGILSVCLASSMVMLGIYVSFLDSNSAHQLRAISSVSRCIGAILFADKASLGRNS